MAKSKRLTDCNKWTNGSWFRNLSPKNKLFWFYIHDMCDQGGVWEVDEGTLNFLTGDNYIIDEVIQFFSGKIESIDNGRKLWIMDYCILQQSTLLVEEEANPARKKAVQLMKEHNIYKSYVEYYKQILPGIKVA